MSWFRRDGQSAAYAGTSPPPEVPPGRGAPAADEAGGFSLQHLARHNPGLASRFLWGTNAAPATPSPLFLHLGCGENVIAGFVNLDFIPHDARVHRFELLDHWPAQWEGRADGVFSEDTLEHFFHGEQAYILCNANRMLREGAVARVLMPSYPRLADYGATFKPGPADVMHSAFGVETGADAVNMGMRFSGHRWLHGEESLAALAAMCGFAAEPTACATSSVREFNGINLRDESNSLSFATDLRKLRQVEKLRLEPASVVDATRIEDLPDGAALYRSDAARPMAVYYLPAPVAADDCACINVRSANLSSFEEHNQKWLVLDEARRDDQWHFDETLKSRACMNLVTRNQLPLLLRGQQAFSRLVFSPAARTGDYFTLGCAEVYRLARAGTAGPIV